MNLKNHQKSFSIKVPSTSRSIQGSIVDHQSHPPHHHRLHHHLTQRTYHRYRSHLHPRRHQTLPLPSLAIPFAFIAIMELAAFIELVITLAFIKFAFIMPS